MNKFSLILIVLSFNLTAQAQTVGLMDYQAGTQEGYVLFSPFPSTSTYLIDNCGQLINEWESLYTPAASVVLLENGHLLRTASMGVAANPVFAFGGGGEKIQEIDWDGAVQWEFTYSDSTHRMHHDFSRLPNGNLLIPAWEQKTKIEAIEAGRDSTLLSHEVLWAEYIIEVEYPSGNIVWEWHLWDHLIQDFDNTKLNFGVIAEHPELFDINRTGGPTMDGGRNWLHINSIDYNSTMDQILINSFFVSEFFIIDHSTTIAEAASHSGGNSTKGGDLLYRWGNPQNYDHGTADDRIIFGSHKTHWIDEGVDAGKIMYFNNGNNRPDGSFSSIDIIAPPVESNAPWQYTYDSGVAYAPLSPEWTYVSDPVENFYSNFLSGGQRLSNGNTLVCSGAKGRFFEINNQKEIVWEYINPVINIGPISQGDTIPVVNGRNANIVFRSTRYNPDFPGLANVDLTPGDPIELNFTQPYDCTILSSVNEIKNFDLQIYPNPASLYVDIEINETLKGELKVFDALGQLLENRKFNGNEKFRIDLSQFAKGLYFIKIDNYQVTKIVKH